MQLHVVSGALGVVNGQALIAAPSAGWRINIKALTISLGATGATVTIGFSSTNQRVYQLGANGGVDNGLMDWHGDAATALSITTSANGPCQVTVDYVLESAI